jgi:(2R)-sulfolactate sulfo-lyase subunit alpha
LLLQSAFARPTAVARKAGGFLRRGFGRWGKSPEILKQPQPGANMSPDFIVHEEADGVGVVVVEGLKAGTECNGWIMQENKTVAFKVLSDIPIGHKVALKDFAVNDTVLKYNTDIGKIVAPVKKGEHVHVHNLRTKRW